VELRQYLDVLNRRKWLILQCVVVVALVAGAVSALRTPVYSTSARVLLRPDDPAEQLNPGANGAAYSSSRDPDRYVTAQMDVVTNPDVARAAAKSLKGITPAEVTASVSVAQVGGSDMMDVTSSSADPERARNMANAVAAAYIENRRRFSVAGLQRASGDITKQLAVLQDQIAGYDQRIKGEGADPGASSSLENVSGSGVAAPSGPDIGPTGTSLNNGALPTSDEGLKAARYAAATQYETLFSRQQELRVDMTLKRGEAEIVSPATMPTSPTSPKPLRDAMLGAFLGLLLGLGLAFLRERADDRLHTREEIEQVAELPVLAELPLDPMAIDAPRRLAAFAHPLGRLAESVRSLRTSLAFLGVDGPLERVLVTSAEPGDGKSLVAANLAAVYAQAGYRTILVDSDLRNPRLESIFGGYPLPVMGAAPSGLSGLIAALATGPGASGPDGSAPGSPNGNGNGNGHANGNGNGASGEPLPCNALVANALVRCRHPNLAFLPAGPPPPNPAELLGSRSMTYLLEQLSRLADIVILDAPPLLAVTDPAVLAAKVDGVVLVASIDQTQRGALRRARAMLVVGTARALGVVVNRAPNAKGAYDYDSYYRASADPVAAQPRGMEWLFFWRRPRHTPEPVVDLTADLEPGAIRPDLHSAPGPRMTDEQPQSVRGGSAPGDDR
jgi:succinoglycan biosynthesis transport protein ExoP